MSEGGTKKARLEALVQKVDEEEQRWRELGMHLNMMKYTPEEIFMWKCMQQALVNCFVKGKNEEIDLNIELKEVIVGTMKEIREAVEPQILEAKQVDVPRPNVILPWKKGNGV